jgi:PTH2 family peptidyl-tRNA hydrolase
VPISHLPACNIKAFSYVLIAGASLGLGVYLGSRFGASDVPPVTPTTEAKPEPKPEAEGSDDEDEELADGDLSAVNPRMMDQCKLVGSHQLPRH